MTRSDCC